MLWAFTERLAVGLFVVTFALHAKSCLGVSDQYVGWLISAFMLPFVLAVYPAGRLSDRVGATPVAAAGLTLYGFCWLALSDASAAEAPTVLMLLGASSAAVFAAGLRISGAAPDVTTRIAAMSALNSAGSLGMLVGTAAAGIISAVLRRHGAGPHHAHMLVLQLAGAAQLCTAAATAAMVFMQRRSPRLVRS
jgi:MFS family permease